MGFLQKCHLIIQYKKGSIINLENMLSRPTTYTIISFGILFHLEHFTHDAYKKAYSEDYYIKEVF